MQCDSAEMVELFTNRSVFVILETFRPDSCLDTQSNDSSDTWNVIYFDYSNASVNEHSYKFLLIQGALINACFFSLSFPQFVTVIFLLIPAPTSKNVYNKSLSYVLFVINEKDA